MRLFRTRNVGGKLILHSHLPPLNSRAYSRLVNEHFLRKIDGPSHAQIAVTNACPQRCSYCYNKDRKGKPIDTRTILATIDGLKKMGVAWLGLTGGEPLIKKDLEKIVAAASDNCAVKLFTTGCGLTPERAARLRDAGLFSVSVSLDHWDKGVHDKSRGYPGAFEIALRAIDIFKNTTGLQVGVSTVLSKEMLAEDQVERFVNFLESLGVDEAWLSETKPSVPAFWREDLVITESERLALMRFQDRRNTEDGITVNYLGHFEGREYFGCNAGRKMVYVDPFGEVSPCVFIPMSFGNVRERPIEKILVDMQSRFPSEDACFINKNYRLFRDLKITEVPTSNTLSYSVMDQVEFGPLSKFNQLLQGGAGQ
jgi:MoaA/NifB/PqqE/SkfB family radical SAM enzyme